MNANLRSNSPRVRYPVPYAHVMGERPTLAKRPIDFYDTRPEPNRLVILPGVLRGDEKPYRRAHAHRIGKCGCVVSCDPKRCAVRKGHSAKCPTC